MKIKTLTIAIALTFTLISCSDSAVAIPDDEPYSGVPLVIYDADIGSSTDDLFALQMLHRYQDAGKCKLLGVVVDRMGDNNAAIADLLNTYYGHPTIPIGLERSGIANPRIFIDYAGLTSLTLDDGTPMFARTVTDISTLPDGWQLYRQLLAGQPDHSVSICSVGFVTALAQLLQSEGDDYSPLNGVELVRRKVKCLYIMGGVFSVADESDYNFKQGPDFSQTFFRLWPNDVDICFSPGEVGDGIDYRPDIVIADISWTDIHPIKQVYMLYDCDTGQKMWDPLTVIQAVEGDELFSLSPRGWLHYSAEGATTLTVDPAGNCRYQLPGSVEWNSAMLERVRTLNIEH